MNTKSFANGNGEAESGPGTVPLFLHKDWQLAEAWHFREHQLLGI